MVLPEQLQLSYINTTNHGINMIVTWVRLNSSEAVVSSNGVWDGFKNDPFLYLSAFLFYSCCCLAFYVTGTYCFKICHKTHRLNYPGNKTHRVKPKENDIEAPLNHETVWYAENSNYQNIHKGNNNGAICVLSSLLCCLCLGVSSLSGNYFVRGFDMRVFDGETLRYCCENVCHNTYNPDVVTLNTDNIYRNIYHAEMNNLKPGCEYFYMVGSVANGWSDKIAFRTYTSDIGKTAKFSAAIYGDFGLENSVSLPLLKSFKSAEKYDMILHVGDIAYNLPDNDGKVGDDFMNLIQPLSSGTPYMLCPGNHECADKFLQYRTRYNMPWRQSGSKSNLYYSFDVGDIHFISISTELYFYDSYYTNKDLEAQYNWLVDDLKRSQNASWRVMFGHRPMYCSIIINAGQGWCTTGTETLRDGYTYNGGERVGGLEHLLVDYNVDMFFAGHMHNYERLWPTYREQVIQKDYNKPWGPTHIITGNAGCKEHLDNYDVEKYPWSAKTSSIYGFGILDIYNRSLGIWRQFNADNGDIVDEIIIKK